MEEFISFIIFGVLIWSFIKCVSMLWSGLCNQLNNQELISNVAPESRLSQKNDEPEDMLQHSRQDDSSVVCGRHIRLENSEPQCSYLKQNYKASLHRPYFSKRTRKVIALDTESVGGGYNGRDSILARVSLVTEDGRVYDRYVKPTQLVTDYRTPYSGIREKDLIGAESYGKVIAEVYNILEDCILVGHDLKHDFKVLHLKPPSSDIRDTSSYNLFREMVTDKIIEEEMRRKWLNISYYDPCEMTLCQVRAMDLGRRLTNPKPSLMLLACRLLGREIQKGEHSSVEDAQAAMDLYLLVEEQWEKDSETGGLELIK